MITNELIDHLRVMDDGNAKSYYQSWNRVLEAFVEKDAEIKRLEAENEALKDFAIWMTGCGYDFCQHDYFIKQRDKLLKRTENDKRK